MADIQAWIDARLEMVARSPRERPDAIVKGETRP